MPLKGQEKIGVVLKEFKRGTLRSSSGGKVKKRSQAIAIALSEAGLSRQKGQDSAIKRKLKRKQNNMPSHPEELQTIIPRKRTRAIGLDVARRVGAKIPFDQRVGINPPRTQSRLPTRISRNQRRVQQIGINPPRAPRGQQISAIKRGIRKVRI